MHFYRSSSGKTACIQTPDGHTIDLPRFGARFYLPYHDRPSHMPPAQFIAAMDEHDHDQHEHGHEQHEEEEGDMELSELVDGQPVEPIGPQPLPESEIPTDEQSSKHDLTHADIAARCPHCVAGKAPENKHARRDNHDDPEVRVIHLDYQFFSRDGQLVEEESRAATEPEANPQTKSNESEQSPQHLSKFKIQDWARNGEWESRIASVLDLLDTQLDPREVEKARDVQMATLVEKEFAIPWLKCEMPRKPKLFQFKRVDEVKRRVCRSRFTCADIKRKYTREEFAEETNTFAPTPYEESHVLFELKCLCNGWNSRSGDVRCAYLLGKDSGDAAGNPVHIRVPPEYKQHFEAWLRLRPPETQKKFEGVDLFKDVVLELVGNLYGRRPAGSHYRKEFEEVVTGKLAQRGISFKEANVTQQFTPAPKLEPQSCTM
eukprot:s1981_g12.t1